MTRQRSQLDQLILYSHTAVDYIHGQGAGIGIVQQARCPKTGTIDHRIPSREYVFGWTRAEFTRENIKTLKSCQLLALLHALGSAHRTVKGGTRLQKVIIYSESPWAVETINHHLQNAPKSLLEVVSANDRALIQRVLEGVRRLSRYCPEVSVIWTDSMDKAAARARTLSRRKGRKACKSRRQLFSVRRRSGEEIEAINAEHG